MKKRTITLLDTVSLFLSSTALIIDQFVLCREGYWIFGLSLTPITLIALFILLISIGSTVYEYRRNHED